MDNLRLKVAVVLQLTTCSAKLFQAFTLRHTNELELLYMFRLYRFRYIAILYEIGHPKITKSPVFG